MDTEKNSGSDLFHFQAVYCANINALKKVHYGVFLAIHSIYSIKRISFAKLKHLGFTSVMSNL
jgi:hypothetical protein